MFPSGRLLFNAPIDEKGSAGCPPAEVVFEAGADKPLKGSSATFEIGAGAGAGTGVPPVPKNMLFSIDACALALLPAPEVLKRA